MSAKHNELPPLTCPNCKHKPMEEVVNAAEKKRKGWWCSKCHHFKEAKGHQLLLK